MHFINNKNAPALSFVRHRDVCVIRYSQFCSWESAGRVCRSTHWWAWRWVDPVCWQTPGEQHLSAHPPGAVWRQNICRLRSLINFQHWLTNGLCRRFFYSGLCSYRAGTDWEHAFSFMLGVIEFRTVSFAKKVVCFLTIFWSSSADSCARSRSLLSTTKIRPWRNNTTQVNHTTAPIYLFEGWHLVFKEYKIHKEYNSYSLWHLNIMYSFGNSIVVLWWMTMFEFASSGWLINTNICTAPYFSCSFYSVLICHTGPT